MDRCIASSMGSRLKSVDAGFGIVRPTPGRMDSMQADTPKLPLLDQREIEARIIGPLVRAFAEEIGQEQALAIVGRVIRNLARERCRTGSASRRPDTGGFREIVESLAGKRRSGTGDPGADPDRTIIQRDPVSVRRDVSGPGARRPGRQPLVPARLRPGSGIQSFDRADADADDHGRCAVLRFPVSPGWNQRFRSGCTHPYRRSGRGGRLGYGAQTYWSERVRDLTTRGSTGRCVVTAWPMIEKRQGGPSKSIQCAF